MENNNTHRDRDTEGLALFCDSKKSRSEAEPEVARSFRALFLRGRSRPKKQPMYKTSFPTYGSSSIIIEIRSHQQLSRHFKVIGHWKKDLSDREEVISASKDQAHMICTMMNAGHGNFTEVLRGLEAQNLSLQERIEIIADVNWRAALGWKIAAFITGTLAGIALAACINQLVY